MHIVDVVWSTFFKPENLYLFTPWQSCHKKSVLVGILITERLRIQRTCKYSGDAQEAWAHLRTQFISRGYPGCKLNAVEETYVFGADSLCKPGSRLPVTLVPFKLQYFHGAASFKVGSIVCKHLHMLGFSVDPVSSVCMYHDYIFRFLNCWLSKPNLFRSRYARFFRANS